MSYSLAVGVAAICRHLYTLTSQAYFICSSERKQTSKHHKQPALMCSACRCWKKSGTWATPPQTWSWSGSPPCWRKLRKRTRWRRGPLSASSRRRKNSWQVSRTASSRDALRSARSLESGPSRAQLKEKVWTCACCPFLWLVVVVL